MPSLPSSLFPLSCQHNCAMSAKPGLHCDLNWGLKLKSNTRIKRRVKDKSSHTSCLSHKTMKHKRNKTFVLKHKSSCARKVMEQTVGSEGVKTQLRKGLINLTTAQAQWVERAHSWFPTLFQCCLTRFASSLLWVRSTERASLFNLSGQSPLVGRSMACHSATNTSVTQQGTCLRAILTDSKITQIP